MTIKEFLNVFLSHNKYLFRVIRDEEMPLEEGIVAKNPESKVSLPIFVQNGSNMQTQFIATTRSFASAIFNAKKDCKRIAVIDPLLLPETVEIYDVSTAEKARAEFAKFDSSKGYKRAVNYASASKEIDLIGAIPAEAVMKVISLEDGKFIEAYDLDPMTNVPEYREKVMRSLEPFFKDGSKDTTSAGVRLYYKGTKGAVALFPEENFGFINPKNRLMEQIKITDILSGEIDLQSVLERMC